MKTMHGVVVAGLMAAMTLVAGAQTSATVKDDLFAGTEMFAKNATDVNEITMDPGTLGMVNGKDGKRAHNMVLSVVRTYSYDKPGMYRIEDVDAFRNKLNTGEWHCSVHTRSLKTGESTDVCNKQRTDDMKETAIITVEPKELTFIHTIVKNGTGGGTGGGSGDGMSYIGPGMMSDPAMKAQMAIGMAQMQAQMAEMRAMHPQLSVNLANLERAEAMDWPKIQVQVDAAIKAMPKVDSAEMQKKIDDAIKSRGDSRKQSAEKQPK